MNKSADGFTILDRALLGLISNCLFIPHLVNVSSPITSKHSFISKAQNSLRNLTLPLICNPNLQQ